MTPVTPNVGEPNDIDQALALSHAERSNSSASSDKQSDQRAMDLVDEASMQSFPCSDPPSYTRCHA